MGSAPRAPITIPTDPASVGYLAGLLDGEGYIGISTAFAVGSSRSQSYSVRVVIATCSDDLMTWLRTVVGGSVSTPNVSRRHPHWKPVYKWQLFGRNAETFLRAVLPHLVIKGEQAELILRLRDLQKAHGRRAFSAELQSEREEMKRRLHLLNARGAVA